jgi:hypothetical protein
MKHLRDEDNYYAMIRGKRLPGSSRKEAKSGKERKRSF